MQETGECVRKYGRFCVHTRLLLAVSVVVLFGGWCVVEIAMCIPSSVFVAADCRF